MTPDEYGAVARMLADDIGIELFDDSTYEPSRLMYWPSTSSDGEYVFREFDGRRTDPDEVLSRYKDWHDVSSWPVSNRQSTVVDRNIKKQADPLSKDGLIGKRTGGLSLDRQSNFSKPNQYLQRKGSTCEQRIQNWLWH